MIPQRAIRDTGLRGMNKVRRSNPIMPKGVVSISSVKGSLFMSRFVLFELLPSNDPLELTQADA